jgi:hypothetical protein
LAEGVLRKFTRLSKGQFPELAKIWEREVDAKFPLDDLGVPIQLMMRVSMPTQLTRTLIA